MRYTSVKLGEKQSLSVSTDSETKSKEHPTLYTVHRTPYTLHSEPYTLHPTPYTLHPTPYTLHPTPYTLHPTPFILKIKDPSPRPVRYRQLKTSGVYRSLGVSDAVDLRANLKSISHRFHLFKVASVWELTKQTIHLPLGCLQGGTAAWALAMRSGW